MYGPNQFGVLIAFFLFVGLGLVFMALDWLHSRWGNNEQPWPVVYGWVIERDDRVGEPLYLSWRGGDDVWLYSIINATVLLRKADADQIAMKAHGERVVRVRVHPKAVIVVREGEAQEADGAS